LKGSFKRTFIFVASWARQTEIAELSLATVLLGDDVIDLA